ncbi:type ISP restriction/modification enzyme [Nesterenkonia sp. K-15-9-6]|uniref:type ISP restriction/modification enzyme n=1 Tax=Nesterenkonia sp. K-15-9-6 TaxID=3093918 RepID=UPI004044E6EE
MAQRRQRDPVRVFVSYKKHDDSSVGDGTGRAFVDGLSGQIRDRAGQAGVPVELWYDRQLEVGQRWNEEIRSKLHAADIYIAVYSPGFFDENGYIAAHELPVMVAAAADSCSKVPPRVMSISRSVLTPEDIPAEFPELSALQAANEGRPLDAESEEAQDQITENFAALVVGYAQKHYDARAATKTRPVIEAYLGQLVSHMQALETDSRTSPEDPLKAPFKTLIESLSSILDRAEAKVSFEARTTDEDEISGVRLDLSVKNTRGLLVGHIELKSPHKSADPTRPQGWTAHDRRQWEVLSAHPNLIYSNGAEMVHFQRGVIRSSVSLDPNRPPTDAQAGEVATLIGAFLRERPTAPRSPRGLADRLAPLTRLLRDKVVGHLRSVENTDAAATSPLLGKYAAWQQALIPSATVKDFADAFAQCYTYALLIGRFEGELHLPLDERQLGSALRSKGHELLGDVLTVMVGSQTKEILEGPLGLIEALVAHVDPEALTKTRRGGRHQDPWLYFYEDFLAAYDPARREQAGVYYTPLPVVRAQVRMTENALKTRHGARFSDDNVTVLDPALGTGTYLLQVTEQALAQSRSGSTAPLATSLAHRLHGFELMVGSYAVAHLRLTQALTSAGAGLSSEGVKVFLTDTLTAPDPAEKNPGQLVLLTEEAQAISLEQQRSSEVKRADTQIRVIIGNPPYSRGTRENAIGGGTEGSRPNIILEDHNTGAGDRIALLEDFKKDTPGVHVKNLYNSYVYFWRWAIWKACEQKTSGPGIVSFITSSSYLRGPGFAGMRKHMRQKFDEIWILDLGGDNRGAHKEENVFAIQTPVAIVTGVQYIHHDDAQPAQVFYRRIEGTSEDKLNALDGISELDDRDASWTAVHSDLTDSFIPSGEGAFHTWPDIRDVFPWQHSGGEFKRKWPIAPSPGALTSRWDELFASGEPDAELFRETGDRTVNRETNDIITGDRLPALNSTAGVGSMLAPARYGYRSFDRQWSIPDARLADRVRPELWQAHSDQQIYLTTLGSTRLGEGPAVTVAIDVPDRHHFRGSYGGKDVMPLYRDHEAATTNLTEGLLEALSAELGTEPSTQDVVSYVFGLTGTGVYYRRFADDLVESQVRIPFTKDGELFARVSQFGRELLRVATFGQRMREPNRYGVIEPWEITGEATLSVATSTRTEDYPETFDYEDENRILRVGDGRFHHVSRAVWDYRVSGMPVVASWLGHRMKTPSGRSSSPLDKIQPERWEFDQELVLLLHTIENMVAAEETAEELLEEVVASETFTADELPNPADWQTKPPKKVYHPAAGQTRMSL